MPVTNIIPKTESRPLLLIESPEIAAGAGHGCPRHPCTSVPVDAKSRLRYEISGKKLISWEVLCMSIDTTGGHPAMDYREHERTYAGFVFMTKLLVVLVTLLLIGMAVFLV